MNIRNRIIETRIVAPEDVAPNPRNWRTHPQRQRDALRGILAEVGIAAPIVAYYSARNNGRLTIIDGHERMTVGAPFPAVILDVNDEEADKLLATFDPIAALSDIDAAQLDALLNEVTTENQALGSLLDELTAKAKAFCGVEVDEADVWKGMPDFEQNEQKPWKTIRVHFQCKEDYEAFARIIDQPLTERTRYIWFPRKKHDNLFAYSVEEVEDESEVSRVRD